MRSQRSPPAIPTRSARIYSRLRPGAGGWAAESALQNRPSWNSDIHLEHSWRARARWERWERGIVRDEQLRAVAKSRPKCDVGGFVQGITRSEDLDMTR